MDAPNLNVINDYKREYLLRRVAQTAAGGARLRLPFAAPLYVPALQLLVLVAPALLGIPLTLLLAARLAAPLVGAGTALLSLSLQTAGLLAARRAASQRDVKTSILAQDDEVTFEGVFHSSTWGFIVPGKRRLSSLLLHPLSAGLAAAAAAAALSPENLPPIVQHGAALVVVFPVLGWLSACTGLYSVTAARPPEPASLQALDEWEVAALNRPLHLLLLTAPLMAIRLGSVSPVPDWLLTCDVACRLTLCALPLLWLLGVIPPMDVALGWLAEQVLVLVCGGSPCVTPVRLALQLLLGLAQAVLVCCLPPADRLLPAAVGGYLLSTDTAGLLLWLYGCLRSLCRRLRPSLPAGWWRSVLYHAVCAAGAGAVAAAGRLLPPPPGALPSLGAVLLVVMAARAVFVELQRVYCAGLLRNCLYRPAGGHGAVRWVRAVGLRLHTIVTPLLLSVYITWETETETEADPRPVRGSLEDVLVTVCLARCYRWVWQNTEAALPETVAAFVLRLLWPTAASWRPELVLTAVSGLRDRLAQLRGKLYMAAVLQSSWLAAKERRRGQILLAVNVLLLPMTAALLLFSCLVSAPLLPVCTLPLLVATFPRRLAGRVPCRPQTAGPDAVYYQQMADQTADRLGRAIWDGCAGFVRAGDYLLLRFEDRLMWVYVAEMGNGYIYFSIKGLELQETSCHAAEATRVDAIFDSAFEEERSAESVGPLAPFWFHTLTPLTQLRVPGYSDARSQLTGVIDNSATLAAIEELFPKVLAWALVEHLLTTDAAAEEEKLLAKAATSGGKGAGRTDSMERYRTALSSPAPPPLVGEVGDWSDGSQGSLMLFETKRPAGLALGAAPWLRQVLDAEDSSPGSDGEAAAPPGTVPGAVPGTVSEAVPGAVPEAVPGAVPPLVSSTTIKVRPREGSTSTGDGAMSSRRSTQLPPLPTSSRPSPPRRTPSGAPSGVVSGAPSGAGSATGSMAASPSRRASRLRSGSRVAPAPAPSSEAAAGSDRAPLSPSGSVSVTTSSVGRAGSSRRPSRAAWQPLIPSIHGLAPPTTAARRLTPPASWTLAAPPVSAQLASPFPRQFWLQAVSALLKKEPQAEAEAKTKTQEEAQAEPEPVGGGVVEMLGGEAAVTRLLEDYSLICQLVDTAYHGTARELQASSTPGRVLTLYREGAAPDGPAASWLRAAPVVTRLAQRAYRWSVKLALDSILLGGFDSDDELLDTLEEYSGGWYIGLDTDPGWRQAVLDHTPSLFSLGYDDTRGTFTSHLLSLADQTLSVGSLSSELVRGVWASLALELLYVTNDDEERYSIQAHSTILRNLTVQAADPPLGYPVFSGSPLRSSHV